MNILILEDEALTASDLKRTLLQILPTADIIDIIGSVKQGIDFFRQAPAVDLIFSDIQLADGLSFEIFQVIENSTPIIFCTAFDQYALKAFQTYGIAYILKPFDLAAVERALNKYQTLKGASEYQNLRTITDEIKQQLFPKKTPSSIIIHKGDNLIPLAVKDIALFFIKDESVYALTFRHDSYVVNKKLELLEAALAPLFFRANRQHLISRSAVKNAAFYFNRKLLVNLTIPFEEQVLIGKRKVTAFQEWLSMY